MKNVMRWSAIYGGRKAFVVRTEKAGMSSKMDTTWLKFVGKDIAAVIVIGVLMT